MPEATLTVQECDFIDNVGWSVTHNPPGTTTAFNNYWGDPTGPYQEESNPGGIGDSIQTGVPYQPWSTTHFFAPRLTGMETQVQFGNVATDSAAAFFLAFVNAGVETLQVHLIHQLSTPFQWNGAMDYAIPFGDSIRVPIQFAPEEENEFSDTLRLETNDPTHLNLTIPVEGNAVQTSIGSSDANPSFPSSFRLSDPWPNPFNSECLVELSLPTKDLTTLDLYDVLGRRVQKLIDGELSVGIHRVAINGSSLASGVYFLKATHGKEVANSGRITVIH